MTVELLTDEEEYNLSDKDRETYWRALRLIKQENAGGPGGGWADGHDLLKSLGWMEESRTIGHRRFVSLFKPKLIP